MTKAFNGDEVLLQIVRDLVDKYQINSICETGSYYAETTAELAQLGACEVVSFEINKEYLKIAEDRIKEFSNIRLSNISSPIGIQNLVPTANSKYLFFLDAHWNAYNPLLDELKAIAGLGIKPVILIHDFYVPGKSTEPGSTWGYDVYDGQRYDWEWVKDSIEAIYGSEYKITYNDYYEAFRGCLIVEPIQAPPMGMMGELYTIPVDNFPDKIEHTAE